MRGKHLYLIWHRLKNFIKLFIDTNITLAMALGIWYLVFGVLYDPILSSEIIKLDHLEVLCMAV